MVSVLSFIQSASGNLNSLPMSVYLKHSYRSERFWCFKVKSGGKLRENSEGQGGLARGTPWGFKESDTTERLRDDNKNACLC